MRVDIVTIFPDMVRRVAARGHRGPGARARAWSTCGARPAGLHDRPAPGRRRLAVRRRAGHGAEARAVLPRDGRTSGRRAASRRGDRAAPAGPALHARRRRRRGAARSTWCCCAGGTRASTSASSRRLATDEVSIGDYVLSGGELAAMVVVDAVVRQVPGVVGDAQSVSEDSFARPWLDYPHYTRPAEWDGRRVPEVLLSGHHGEWRAGGCGRRSSGRSIAGRTCSRGRSPGRWRRRERSVERDRAERQGSRPGRQERKQES